MNPQVARLIEVLQAVQSAGARPLWELSPQEARLAADTMIGAAFNDGGPKMAETRELEIRGRRRAIMGRLYVPDGVETPSPGLLYMHGGGWVLGSPDTHDRLARELAVGIGAR